jgi:hypothetical protein
VHASFGRLRHGVFVMGMALMGNGKALKFSIYSLKGDWITRLAMENVE